MLEPLAADGRGRILEWTPREGGPSLRSPALLWTDVPSLPRPDGVDGVVTQRPTGDGKALEIVSGGTWFFEDQEAGNAAGDAVLRPLPPKPTTEVQVATTEGDDGLAVFHDAAGWASNPARLVPALIEARTQATEGRMLWAPGVGGPEDYALWAYLGIEVFDASPLQLAAVRGQALTVDGPVAAADAPALLDGAEGDVEAWDEARLLAFNLEAARRELRLVERAIRDGNLRELVERRVYRSARAVEVLRRFDREHAYLEAASPVAKAGEVACRTQESLWMPEVEQFRRRMARPDGYVPPASADVLVLLPCSARKPYRLSKSHRYFQRALDDSGIRYRCHEVMITSPLGIVPRELENVYPAANYDVPVTGRWSLDEEAVIRDQVAALLAKHDYKHVVAHVGDGTYAFLKETLGEGALHTAPSVAGKPQSIPACTRLRDELRRIRSDDPRAGDFKQNVAVRRREDLAAYTSFQFGATASRLLAPEGARVRGKAPYHKLFAPDGEQMGITTDKGMMSLSPRGAAALAEAGVKRVFIGDFHPKKTSSLFAVGVDGADPDVRRGDDVAIGHLAEDGSFDLRAVGKAQMSAAEMTHHKRGVAVSLRHAA